MANAMETVFDAARALPKYKWKVAAAGGAVMAASIPPEMVGWHDVATGMVGGGAVLSTAVTGWWVARHVLEPGSTKRSMARHEAYTQRNGGVASKWDIAENASPWALRQDAENLRPSMQGISQRQRARIPVEELGCEVVRLGFGWFGERVYSRSEDCTLRIGGPRKGKSGSLGPIGMDAPGALITTSTRSDLAEWVHSTRRDRPVHIFNPSRMLPIRSTVQWSVLIGCEDFSNATRRAVGLIPNVREDDQGARWDRDARELLALYLQAARVSGRRARDIVGWIGDEGKGEAEAEVIAALRQVKDGADERVAAAKAHFATTERTRSGVTHSMKKALSWLSDDQAREIGDADPDKVTFDVQRLIRNRETLHMLGAQDQSGIVAPLIAAFVAEIGYQCRLMARDERLGASHGGRLDPPVTMLLDEAALVCPVPLNEWTADMGGSGITIHISLQSLAQLRGTWGDHRAGEILGNTGTLVVFGGGNGAEDLKEIATLVGEARYKNEGEDHDAADSHRWTQVMSPADIRALRKGRALVLGRDIRAVVGKVPMAWHRKVKPMPIDEPFVPDTATAIEAPEDTIVQIPQQQTVEEVKA